MIMVLCCSAEDVCWWLAATLSQAGQGYIRTGISGEKCGGREEGGLEQEHTSIYVLATGKRGGKKNETGGRLALRKEEANMAGLGFRNYAGAAPVFGGRL
jgi:hypothetical protein